MEPMREVTNDATHESDSIGTSCMECGEDWPCEVTRLRKTVEELRADLARAREGEEGWHQRWANERVVQEGNLDRLRGAVEKLRRCE